MWSRPALIIMANGFIDELRWRGMLQDSTPGVEEHLAKGPQRGYIGFDPTADSLHVGNLVQIMFLTHFQRSGHRAVALVGGATGMVGDPSGKKSERNLLDEEALRHNEACIKAQLQRFLDFEHPTNPAQLVNNYDWFKDMGFLHFIREVGKHITVNYMMAKDSVKNRLETGISFTEFSYQLVQGYDYVHLNRTLGCTLQMGGSDQWGNITTGTELIRRMGGGEAYAVTTPLLTKADGTKFGKSEGGNIWLDAQRTSPYKFYQFWLNASDDDTPRFVRIFSTRGQAELDALITDHAVAPHKRKANRSSQVPSPPVRCSLATAPMAYPVSRHNNGKTCSKAFRKPMWRAVRWIPALPSSTCSPIIPASCPARVRRSVP